MATYNGHKNYDYWNVSLWIGNDEGLYNLARRLVRRHSNRRNAAREFVEQMQCDGMDKTPDGARYTIANVYSAMEDL
jgi:hypothetical protein